MRDYRSASGRKFHVATDAQSVQQIRFYFSFDYAYAAPTEVVWIPCMLAPLLVRRAHPRGTRSLTAREWSQNPKTKQ